MFDDDLYRDSSNDDHDFQFNDPGDSAAYDDPTATGGMDGGI